MTLPPPPAIDYTSRDYLSIRTDLINLIPTFLPAWTSRSRNDFGIVLLELFAYVGDQMNYYADRIANEVYLDTATQRASVIRLARLMGYSPDIQTAATTTLTLTNNTGSPITVPAGTQVSTAPVSISDAPVVFQTDNDVTVAANSTNTVTATQGQTISGEQIGVSDGTADQSYTLFNTGVLQGSVTVTVGSTSPTTWTYISRLSSAGPYDSVFTLALDENEVVSVVFGDGFNGAIPPTGAVINATYKIGVGSAGNVAANSLVLMTGVGGISVFNAAAATGGADDESTDSIRTNAVKAAQTVVRAVTLQDYANLAVLVGGVGRANAASTVYTNVTIYIAPTGGNGYSNGTTGSPTTALTSLISTVQYFLQGVCPAPTTVTVQGPTYVPVNVTVNLHLSPQASQSQAISDATAALNNLLDFDSVVFEDQITANDVYLALSGVSGVIYNDLTLLARDALTGVNVVSMATNEIPTVGTITVTATGGTS